MPSQRSLRLACWFGGVLAVLPLVGARAVVQVGAPSGPLAPLTFRDPRLGPAPAGVAAGAVGTVRPEVTAGLGALAAGAGVAPSRWRGLVDPRSGLLVAAEGPGIPWASGAGNRLRGVSPSREALEARSRALLVDLAPALGVESADLVLSVARSGPVGDTLWLIDFDVVREGLMVEGARVVFRVGHGNLIQLGSEQLPARELAVPPRVLDRDTARAVAAAKLGGFGPADRFLDEGTELLLPTLPIDGAATSAGSGLARAWSFTFRRRGVAGTWRTRVDATTGEWLELIDLNRYGRVTGGVFASSPVEAPELSLPLPFADAAPGPAADRGGVVSGSGPFTSQLRGPYVEIDDACGVISLASDWRGDLAFGISDDSDCATPGVGGAGNTAAARTQFYYVNRAMELGRSWLPANTWLADPLPVATNLPQTCNAYWDGLGLNFFSSGDGCGNTGEIAAISLHEFGHGLDENDGSGISPDYGTGEVYGDVTAALFTRDSCIGPGFLDSNCGGYGVACTSCTGVRDIDWGQRADNLPHTVENFTRLRCPADPGYAGPCGLEGHCESYVASEAVWDFANRDLPSPGSAAAWATTERLWLLSRPTATAAFSCTTGTPPWTASGCGIGSLWKTMRAADDDDGDLSNGTPNSCRLYAAFDRHGIACPADPGANTCFAGCTPPVTPALTATAGVGEVQLSWSASGVGVVYDLYRSDLGCDAGWVAIATDLAVTSHLDTALQPGLAHHYRVIAKPSGNAACSSPPSACQSATASESCVTPAAPTGVAAASLEGTDVTVSWAPVAGAAGYNVYRSALGGGPFSHLATMASTSYTDRWLDSTSTWHYLVRSFVDRCESGDSAVVPATTRSCTWMTLLDQGFASGSGLLDWTRSELPGHTGGAANNHWRGRQSCTQEVFRYGGTTCSGLYGTNQAVAVRPPTIEVPDFGYKTRAVIDHRFSFESGYDGGAIGLALDGAASFTPLPAARTSGLAPLGQLETGAGACEPDGWGNTPVFTGTQASVQQTIVDLDRACDDALLGEEGCGGHDLDLGFLAFADCYLSATGWFLDRVRVEVCAEEALGEDDFETGDLSRWDF